MGESDGSGFTHLDSTGRIRMVDVSGKPITRRTAVAEGTIRMKPDTFRAILAGEVEKGEALAVARLAAIGGAKRTAELVPLCHPITLDRLDTDFIPEPELPGFRLVVRASAEARTGVEMEALTGTLCGLIALYDMCKGLDRGMAIGSVRVLEKSGGRSGEWRAADA